MKNSIDKNITVKPIRNDELKKIKPHKHRNFEHSCADCQYYLNLNDSYSQKKKWFKQMKLKYNDCAYVLYYKKDLVGYIQFAPKKEFPRLEELEEKSVQLDAWYISCIYLIPGIKEPAKKELVSFFFDYVLKELKKRGVKKVQISPAIKEGTISSTQYTWEFYEKFGFEKIGGDDEYVVSEKVLND